MGEVIKQYPGLEYKVEPFQEEVLPIWDAGDVVLSCGDKPLKLLQSASLLPKGRTVGSCRGKIIDYDGVSILCTYDSRLIDRDYGRMTDIQWDTNLAVRLVQTGTLLPVVGNYLYKENFDEIIDYIEKTNAKTGRAVNIASDLETVGLDEYNSEAFIVSISFTHKKGVSHMIRFRGHDDQPVQPVNDYTTWRECTDLREKLWMQIDWLLTSPMVAMRGANYKYDCRWMFRKWQIECTNLKMDTTLVGSLVDENRSNSLNIHAKVFTEMGGYDDDFNQKWDKSRMDLVPDEDLLLYAGGDTDACYQVADKLRIELLQDDKLANFYLRLLHPSSKAFEYMEREGVLIDLEYYNYPVAEYEEYEEEVNGEKIVKKKLVRGLKAEVESFILECEKQALKLMSQRLKNKHLGQVSLTRSALLKEFMFGPLGLSLKPKMYTAKVIEKIDESKKAHKKDENVPIYAPPWKEASTASKHLLMFDGDPVAKVFVDKLKEYTQACKTMSTYIEGFFEYMREDGRFHPSYMLYKGDYQGEEDSGTNTGRCLTGDAVIETNKGMFTIKEIYERFDTFDDLRVLTHTGQWQKVTEAIGNGQKPVFKITTNSGKELRSTDNHPYMTPNDWTELQELSVGDYVYSKNE